MAGKIKKHLKDLFLSIGISAGITALVFLLTHDSVLQLSPLKLAELSFVDYRFQHRGVVPRGHDSTSIVIVEISPESQKSLPDKWPWPGTYFARLVRNLKRAGAKAVGIDITFGAEDSRNPGNDLEFRRAIREAGNVVLAGSLESEKHPYTLLRGAENYGNIYIDSTTTFGLTNAIGDADGLLRRYMPFGFDDARERRIPTFAFALLDVCAGQSSRVTPTTEEDHFEFQGRWIPRYDNRSLLVNFYGPSGTFPRIKFADVIDDSEFTTVDEAKYNTQINTFDDPYNGYLYDGTFKNKIVLVGSTTPEDKDLFYIPIGEGKQTGDNRMYGVEVHANVIQNVLDRNFIYRQPVWSTLLVIFGLSLSTFAFTSGFKSIKVRYSSLIDILGVALLFAELFIFYSIAIKLFASKSYLVDMVGPFLSILISYVGSIVFSYMSERRQKVLIKTMFGHYVNRSVVDEMVEHPERLRLAGDRREMTVMFTDIENFTSIAEKMKAEELVKMLNEYLNEMTGIVFNNSGTVDKYEGDAIMVFWGAPVLQPDHAVRACSTAVEMQQALIPMRRRWIETGRKPINVRIGINTGEMIVGNIGGSGKFEYTVIGDSVNIGARLEGANKQYKTNIMISESTYNKVADRVIARELDMLVVAGRTEPIRVYELCGMAGSIFPPAKLRFIECYSNGLRKYRNRDWEAAIAEFSNALKIVPEDYPSNLYIERSYLYQASPPPDDWNGVFILMTK